jgi:hypothetical protein
MERGRPQINGSVRFNRAGGAGRESEKARKREIIHHPDQIKIIQFSRGFLFMETVK